jgi:hypothetical protein
MLVVKLVITNLFFSIEASRIYVKNIQSNDILETLFEEEVGEVSGP